jgi:hypothetical protein
MRSKCAKCDVAYDEKEELCERCTPHPPIELTNLQISRLFRAAGIKSEKSLSKTNINRTHEEIQSIKYYAENLISNFHPKNIRELAYTMFKIRYKSDFEGKIEILRRRSSDRFDGSFSIPVWGDSEFYLSCEFGIIPRFGDSLNNCFFIFLGESHLSIPTLCEFHYSLDDKQITDELLKSLSAFYLYYLIISDLNSELSRLYDRYVHVSLPQYFLRLAIDKFNNNNSIQPLIGGIKYFNDAITMQFFNMQKEFEKILKDSDREAYISLLEAKSLITDNGEYQWIILRKPWLAETDRRLRILL